MNFHNPFHELYLGESIGANEFVQLFSDVMVGPSLALFQPGNVVLSGLPGSGKSMMLNLLKPSIRRAYKESGINFPVPKEYSKFIGAGINLQRSSIADLGQRPIRSENVQDELSELAVFFGDFINYSITRDIINSIEELHEGFDKEIGINLSKENKDAFTKVLIKDECWFGYLNDVKDWDNLKHKLKSRLQEYRSYLNYNKDFLDSSIINSKTSIGIPIIVLAKHLRECGILANDVKLYVRLDQYEDLVWLNDRIPNLGTNFQSIIYKLLAIRDVTVSYKIGTRPFAWKYSKQEVAGTSAVLEQYRNYTVVSLEHVLKRKENSRSYIFPKLAEDIFKRRLKNKMPDFKLPKTNCLEYFFGKGMDARERALKLVKKDRDKVVKFDSSWPASWKKFLLSLSKTDPFSAKLAEAWAKQKGKEQIVDSTPTERPYPWESKKYWVKERTAQALIQIASRNRQQIIWEGVDDILNLSSGSLLGFLSICQQVWEAAQQDIQYNKYHEKVFYPFPAPIQTIAILEASLRWVEDIIKQPGGHKRKKFVIYLGTYFYNRLTSDDKMSYPGSNGFSLPISVITENAEIEDFLLDACDYGDILTFRHTPKNKGAKSRQKFYLNPIFSPYFKIPAIRTKEPIYFNNIEDIKNILFDSGAFSDFAPPKYVIGSKLKTNKIDTKNNFKQGGQYSLFE
ncbi:hypothetical protein [Cesiribacter sp. SM1]|uniref:ORC-CDC6 family AAA ATPase n=1 Tax=Cesiribacter sp. SM1 TaxID=2861196 RepID=UPI001CD57A98|nr:hypothetical protein [Cesiribacter sp. SM1]